MMLRIRKIPNPPIGRSSRERVMSVSSTCVGSKEAPLSVSRKTSCLGVDVTFGRGIGNSIQKLGFVPEAQNDMIFSIICEEMGLTGAIILILIFALLLWRLCVISMNCQELSGAMIAAGIMGHLAIQVILNIAVVTNTIPNTGITLPFISYGGTSIVFLLGEMGLALNVSRQKNNPPTR